MLLSAASISAVTQGTGSIASIGSSAVTPRGDSSSVEERIKKILANAHKVQLLQQGQVKDVDKPKPKTPRRKASAKNMCTPGTSSNISIVNTSSEGRLHPSSLQVSKGGNASGVSSCTSHSNTVCIAETLIQMAAGKMALSPITLSADTISYNCIPQAVQTPLNPRCSTPYSSGQGISQESALMSHDSITSNNNGYSISAFMPYSSGSSIYSDLTSHSYEKPPNCTQQNTGFQTLKCVSGTKFTPGLSVKQMSPNSATVSGHISKPSSLSSAADCLGVSHSFVISSCQTSQEETHHLTDSALPPSLTSQEAYSPPSSLSSMSYHEMQSDLTMPELTLVCAETPLPFSNHYDAACRSDSSRSSSRTKSAMENPGETSSCPILSPHFEEHHYAAVNDPSIQTSKLNGRKSPSVASRRLEPVTVEIHEESSSTSLNIEMPDLSPQVRAWTDDVCMCNVTATTTFSHSQSCRWCHIRTSPSPPLLQPFHSCVTLPPSQALPQATISCCLATSPRSVSPPSDNSTRSRRIGSFRGKSSQTPVASTAPVSNSDGREDRMRLTITHEGPPVLTQQGLPSLVSERNTPPLLCLAQEACRNAGTLHSLQLGVIGELSMSTGKQVYLSLQCVCILQFRSVAASFVFRFMQCVLGDFHVADSLNPSQMGTKNLLIASSLPLHFFQKLS